MAVQLGTKSEIRAVIIAKLPASEAGKLPRHLADGLNFSFLSSFNLVSFGVTRETPCVGQGPIGMFFGHPMLADTIFILVSHQADDGGEGNRLRELKFGR